MYLFSFKQYAGHDKVFQSQLSIGKPGDLIKSGTDFFVNLGNEISFPELIKTQFTQFGAEVVYPGFFDEKFLKLIHRMVYQWYSTYNNVIKYFVSYEINQLLSQETKAKKINYKKIPGLSMPIDEKKQNLIIVPDNRSRENQLSNSFFNENVIHLHSTDTQTCKDKHWREIKKSKSGIIVATQSEVFQPFCNLGKIFLIDDYKWYYHNQQDPRYDIVEVVNKMHDLRGCDVVKLNNIGKIN